MVICNCFIDMGYRYYQLAHTNDNVLYMVYYEDDRKIKMFEVIFIIAVIGFIIWCVCDYRKKR